MVGITMGLLLAIGLAQVAEAANPLIACALISGFPLNTPPLKHVGALLDTTITKCSNAGYRYAYWGGQRAFSWCDNNPAGKREDGDLSKLVDGLSSTTCTVGMYLLGAQYNFEQCYGETWFYPGPYTGSRFSTSPKAYYTSELTSAFTPAACLDGCAAQYGKYGVWSYADKAHPCVCAANYQGTPATCSNTTYTVESFTGTIPSGLPGYQRRSVIERARREEQERPCPRGMIACSTATGGFECIDPASDLESCGGCVNGGYGNTTATAGVDCVALPGADPRRVTCNRGACMVSGCRRGFMLQNGQCVPVKARWTVV